MKILVFAYDLSVAGVTVNAIELAAALRDLHGHDVVLFAGAGPMQSLACDKRLNWIPAPSAKTSMHPSPIRLRALREVVQREKPDLVHAWDWMQCLDVFFREHLVERVPLAVTDMCMSVQRLLPRCVPTTFGTPELLERARAKGHRSADYLLPPVDVALNAPDVVDPVSFRRLHGIERDQILLVTASRLEWELKGESLVDGVNAMRNLGRRFPVKFLIVGDGAARSALESLASRVNAELGYRAVVFTGSLIDPRPAYAAADIVLGMGSSALRGMAFAKPVIVTGERGFSSPFTPATAPQFLYRGFYGVGDGSDGSCLLQRNILSLLENRDELAKLGSFSRDFVIEHCSLEVVSERLSRFCSFALAGQPSRLAGVVEAMRVAAMWTRERRFVPSSWRKGSPRLWHARRTARVWR